MHDIHRKCVDYGTRGNGWVNYVDGANIGGFVKVADAMLAYGVMWKTGAEFPRTSTALSRPPRTGPKLSPRRARQRLETAAPVRVTCTILRLDPLTGATLILDWSDGDGTETIPPKEALAPVR